MGYLNPKKYVYLLSIANETITNWNKTQTISINIHNVKIYRFRKYDFDIITQGKETGAFWEELDGESVVSSGYILNVCNK